MPLVDTESLVIRSYNLAEADKIVVLLTRDHGIVRGVAKGARRLKSVFGSALEPFSIVRVEYFQKETSELVSIQKIDLLQSNFAAAADPAFLQKFSYLADLLLLFSPPHDPNETLYRMTRACLLAAVSDRDSLPGIGVYFELWLLKLAGFLPDWARCDVCNSGFDADEGSSLLPNLHLVCDRCGAKGRNSRVNGTVRSIVARVWRVSPESFAVDTIDQAEELRSVSQISRQLMSRAIGKEVASERSLAVNN